MKNGNKGKGMFGEKRREIVKPICKIGMNILGEKSGKFIAIAKTKRIFPKLFVIRMTAAVLASKNAIFNPFPSSNILFLLLSRPYRPIFVVLYFYYP